MVYSQAVTAIPSFKPCNKYKTATVKASVFSLKEEKMFKRKKWFVAIPIVLFAKLSICVQAKITALFEGWAYGEVVENMSPVLTVIIKGITHIGDSISVWICTIIVYLFPMGKQIVKLVHKN